MRISKEEMEAAKRGQDLRAVIESYGGKLRKKGANYVGLCPFHEEKTPSFTVNPKTNLWHCFGCNAGGDVIGFVCKKEGIGFREAMEKLRIQKPGVREALKEIGILNSKGHEMFYGCVVFPVFDENQDCVGLYGRRIAEGEVNHLYLPGPRRGVFNYQAVKRSKSVILTESIIDALSLYQAGFKEVIPCYGVNGLTEDHLQLFARYLTKEGYICFDRDEAGEQGEQRIAGQLKEKGMEAYLIHLPASSTSQEKVDLNSFFSFGAAEDRPFGSAQDRLLTAEAAKVFAGLLQEANPRVGIYSDKIAQQEQRHYEKTESSFIVQYGERRYEVRGITREGVKLKATLKAVKQKSPQPIAHSPSSIARFHLDTVDLYSSRSRFYFARACAGLFGEKEEIITEDPTRLIELCESWKPEERERDSVPKMTQSEEEEAL